MIQINNDVDASRILGAIKQIEDKISSVKDSAALHKQFFKSEEERLENQRNYLAQQLENYLEKIGEKSLKLPFGKIQARTTRKAIWPDDETLVSFSKEKHIPIRVKEEPDKKALKSYIDEHLEYPPGYEVKPVTSVTVKPTEEAYPDDSILDELFPEEEATS